MLDCLLSLVDLDPRMPTAFVHVRRNVASSKNGLESQTQPMEGYLPVVSLVGSPELLREVEQTVAELFLGLDSILDFIEVQVKSAFERAASPSLPQALHLFVGP